MALLDGIAVVSVEESLAFVLHHFVEDSPIARSVHQRRVEIDDDITIDVSTVIATAINITTLETAVEVGGGKGSRLDRLHVITR